MIASGSADKMVRIWDPKIGGDKAQVMRLQSHTDLVRDILVSDDGRWVLSCSSDASIKLWSLAMPNYCVSTFSNSDASVWCLETDSPTFRTFWAGTRNGWVYKIRANQNAEDNFTNCIAICKQETPILSVNLV